MSQLGQWAKGLFSNRPTVATTTSPVGGGVAGPVRAAQSPSVAAHASSAVPTEVVATPSTPVRENDEAQVPVDGGDTGVQRQSKFLMVLVGLAAIGLSLWMMNQYANFLAPLFFTLNLMITAYPLYRILTRYRVPKVIATTVTGLVVVAVLALFLFGMYWSVAAMVNKLPEYNEQFQQMYSDIIAFLGRLGLSEEMMRDQIASIDPKQVAGVATSVLSDVGSIGSMMVIIITAMIFMLMDTPQMEERLSIARPGHGGFIEALGGFTAGIRRYWIVTTVFGLIVAVLDFAVLVGLGVPLALVWGIFSFLTNYIPNIGFVIGLVPPALLALFDSGPRTAIAVVIAYSVLNFVVQSIIQPKFAGNAVGLTPTLSFVSLLLWTAVLGPLGALLALPMSLLVKALLVDPDPNARWVNALISSRPQDAIPPASSN